MKNIVLLILTFTLLLSCQSDKKPHKNNQEKPETLQEATPVSQDLWHLNEDKSSIHWTGYKTTDKVAVNGVFQNFTLKGIQPASDLKTAIKNAQVSINIYSIFSKEESRDEKLIQYLFETMTGTKTIDARIEKINPDGKSALVNIYMNNHEKLVPMQLQIDPKTGQIILTGKIDLIKDFAAGTSLEKLHKACYDLHTGKDGVSKTWPEVGVKAVLIFEKK